MTDSDIVERSLSDPQLFGSIFDRHFVAIHAYFARRVARTDADDLAGEVFRIAFEKRAGFDPGHGYVRPWLFGISHNVLSRHFRSSTRKDRAVTRLGREHNHNDGGVEDRIDAAVNGAELHRLLEGLRPEEREALILFAVDQLSYDEIAAVMDTPIGTVRSRISRARATLRPGLDRTTDLVLTHTPLTTCKEPRHG